MLTKADLKEIRKIIREEVENEVQNTKDELQADQKMNLIRIVTEIRGVENRLKNLEIRITKVQKDLKYTINFLDKEGLKVIKRIERIEEHLHLPPLS